MFYSNELLAAADEFKINSLCQWPELPTKGFPIIFHGVEGEDSREGISPSFFNPHEAVEVVQYVRKLLDHRSLGVTPDEIGVISPYKKQVQFLSLFAENYFILYVFINRRFCDLQNHHPMQWCRPKMLPKGAVLQVIVWTPERATSYSLCSRTVFNILSF